MRFVNKALASRHLRQFIILLVADAVLFTGTNARTAPSYMLVVGFILLMATVYVLWGGLFALAALYGFKVKRRGRFAFYLTCLVGMVVALQSIGELSPRDVAVLLPLAVIAYLYSSYGIKKAGSA